MADDEKETNNDMNEDANTFDGGSVNELFTEETREDSKIDSVAPTQDEPPVEEEVNHKRQKDEKVVIPDDFYYAYDEFMSKPFISEESGLPSDVVKLAHSFGYNCQKRDNLALLDQQTLCYISGNYIEFMNLTDFSHSYLRSLSGEGIGCMAVHPTKMHLAIGEKNSVSPPVTAIYEYPSLKLYRILRDGTERAYSYCQFNTSGELLATVGSDPDFMLTVWEWKNEQTVLRSKAFSQDIYRVAWSADLEGVLTTAGTGHIRFWKMADTFTGLKLQGDIGKFGKTEISDVEGFVVLPDGKVLSGSEWGNMLVWDGELIKVQIGRKNKKPCHNGTINQIIIEEGELMTLGTDGKINTWDFETIDTAEVSEEMATFEMDPMNELLVSSDAKLMHVVKSPETESSIWYAQDGNGKIWKLDLSFSHTSAPPEILNTFHSGEIRDCDVSPLSYLSASIGSDGSLRVFDFAARKLMAEIKFNFEGSKILWAPLKVDPKGKTIIAGFHDGVIRILNFTQVLQIDISKKSKTLGEIHLTQATKPHTKKITSLCTDDNGQILITGSEDETVFFFSINPSEYLPIGFVKLNKPIHHVEWKATVVGKPDEGIGRIMVYMAEGEVAEVICPNPSSVDHSKTYELREIEPINTYKFVSIKSVLRHEEELEAKRIEEEERQKILAKERKERLERGVETEEEQMKQIEEDEKRRAEEAAKEEEWLPFIPETVSPILYGFIDKTDSNKFWLSMGEYDAGYLYQCEFPSPDKKNLLKIPEKYNEPISHPGLLNSNDVPVTSMKWSSSGKRVVMGCENGSIRLQNLEKPFDLKTMTSCWQYSVHDNNYGSITSLCVSYDEKFLISVGNDGNFFVYEIMDENLQEKEIEEYRARLPSAKTVDSKRQIDDIEDPNAYSIEEHKQKSEYDRKVRLAQEKKASTLKKIGELQKQFKNLKDQNDKLPERIRISANSFELIPKLKEDLIRIKEEKIQVVHKQMAFDSEKHRIALDKLEKRFREPLECDLIVIHAIESEHTVSTIKGCNLSEEYFQILSDLERIRQDIINKDMSKETTLTDKVPSTSGVQNVFDDVDEPGKIEDSFAKYNLKGARGMRVARQLKKLDDNRRKRSYRKLQWDTLYAEKPMENFEDPRDIAAIEEARNKMGDFKLKSSADYFVEEKERPNALKARQELIAIENKIYHTRSEFNRKVLKLRTEKREIIETINKTNKQIELCNTIDKDKKRSLLPNITIYPDENPEKKFEYTKETLIEFKKELEERKKAALQGDESSKTAFATFNKQSNVESGLKPTKIFRPHMPQQVTLAEDPTLVLDEDLTSTAAYSDLQRERQLINDMKTIHLTETMINETLKQMRIFDTKLKLLRHEKYAIGLTLRRAILRQLTVFEEYRLLKMYEKSERNLIEKTEEKSAEKLDIVNKVAELQLKLDIKKKDIDRLIERDRINWEKFKESLGENNKFAEYLNKVYKKKIKRRKKEAEGVNKSSKGNETRKNINFYKAEDSDESSESDDSDLDDEEGESDEEAVVYDLDMCPPGCSQELYDSTCQLRELHLDIEEEMTEEKKVFEALKKEQENLNKKTKVVESALLQAKKELEAFQLEKQQKLNQLKTIVILKLHQILLHENGVLPSNIDAALIFEASNYKDLKLRIEKLQDEERKQLNHGKQVKLRHVKLQQNRKLFQRKISEFQLECDEMMKTKFGKLDNLEKIEQVMINPKIEELFFKMLDLQDGMYCEQSEWEDRIRDAQEKCIEEIKFNTCTLDHILNLFNEKELLEDKLNSKQKDLGGEFQLTGPAAEEEIAKLNQLVHIQAQELDALKEEIGMLSRKGGHILPPMSQNNFSNRGTIQELDFNHMRHSSLGQDGFQDNLAALEEVTQ